jgi:predicted RNA-binding Zn-ribbon protein involved in translation (DUF1610 family)
MDATVTTEPGEVTVAKPFPWWWLLLLLIPVLLLVLYLLLRTKKRPAEDEDEDEEDLVAVAEEEPLRQRCVKCQKTIKIPASMMGRKFRCPKCGTGQVARA